MMLNEIIVLIFGIIIAVTILLMLRKIFFGSRTNLKINKKVNSRELFEPLENDLSLSDEVSSFDDTEAIEEPHCLLYTSPSPRDKRQSRMPSSA